MTTTTTRAKFETTMTGAVKLTYASGEPGDEGRTIERTFTLRGRDEGYVYEYVSGGDVRQVCHGLASMGNTLTATAAGLLDTIRREYQSMRRAEKREAARWYA